VLPAFSSGQWAGTVPATWAAIGSDDLLFMAGGGILAHPAAGGRRGQHPPGLGRRARAACRWPTGARRARTAAPSPSSASHDAARRRQAPAVYYGDDFTGATDTLGTAARAGLRALLFLKRPTPRWLRAPGRSTCWASPARRAP
jgi:hypothetical protein